MVSPKIPTNMMNLPNEVLSDIFIRLLVKQLVQMRSVCKPWNALLSDSSFIKSHLHRSIHSNNDILLVFDHVISDDRKPFSTHPSQSPGLESTNNIILPVNPLSKVGHDMIIGYVNDLICLSYGSYHDDYVIYIWNPSLSAVLPLSPFSLHSQNSVNIHLSFGFDPQSDDYKVLKLAHFSNPRRMVPEVEVYSMRKGSWELLTQSFPLHVKMIRLGYAKVCVDGHNGHLHWLGYVGSEQKPETIVAFDLGAETFHEIPLLDSIMHRHGFHLLVLGVLGGKLGLVWGVSGVECQVWVMDEYGVAESWVNRQVFVFLQLIGHIHPYGFTSHNEFIFYVDCQLYLYDPTAAETKTFKITDRVGKM